MGKNIPDVTDKSAVEIIRRTASALVDDGFFRQADLDDLVQELTLAVLESCDKFDPERAKWTTFVKTVVRRRAISLCRAHTAERRGPGGGMSSLDVVIGEVDGQLIELADAIREDENLSKLGHVERERQEQVELAMDVEAAVAGLPPELQDLCRRLQSDSVTEVARELNMPRTTLLSRVKQIREHFERLGLGAYLQPNGSDA